MASQCPSRDPPFPPVNLAVERSTSGINRPMPTRSPTYGGILEMMQLRSAASKIYAVECRAHKHVECGLLHFACN